MSEYMISALSFVLSNLRRMLFVILGVVAIGFLVLYTRGIVLLVSALLVGMMVGYFAFPKKKQTKRQEVHQKL